MASVHVPCSVALHWRQGLRIASSHTCWCHTEAFDQDGLVQASRTCCRQHRTGLLTQQLCFSRLQPEPPLAIARDKSPWKHPPGNALLRGRVVVGFGTIKPSGSVLGFFPSGIFPSGFAARRQSAAALLPVTQPCR